MSRDSCQPCPEIVLKSHTAGPITFTKFNDDLRAANRRSLRCVAQRQTNHQAAWENRPMTEKKSAKKQASKPLASPEGKRAKGVTETDDLGEC